MSIWEGLFRPREQQQPGSSPATPHLSSIAPTSFNRAAAQPATAAATGASAPSSSSGSMQHRQQPWHGAWQQQQQQQPPGLVRDNTSSSSIGQLYRGYASAAGLAVEDAVSASSGSQPVTIPEARVLPYSRLRAHASSSVSPSPSKQVLSENGSPGPEMILASAAPGFSSNGIVVQGQINPVPRAVRASSSSGSLAQQQQQQQGGSSSELLGASNVTPRRPPLAPSPRSRVSQQQQPGFNSSPQHLQVLQNPSSLAAALHPASSTGSGPGHEMVLGAAGPSSTSSRVYHQQFSLQPSSGFPGGEGLLSSQLSRAAAAAAGTVGEAVAAVAGNPHHPHHQQTMQLLLQHQQHQLQQLQALQQQQQQQQQQQAPQLFRSGPLPIRGAGAHAAAAAAGGGASSLGYYGGGLGGQSPQSPRVLTRRANSFNRLSELGTSPGLVEASFMGLAARAEPTLHTRRSFSGQSTTLQQQQQQQQRALHGSKSSTSFPEWDAILDRRSGGALSNHDSSTGGSTVGQCGTGSTAALPGQQYNCTAIDMPTVLPGQRGGMRAMPGSTGVHWVSRASEDESAARGLLGLPRPGFRGDHHGIVRSGSAKDLRSQGLAGNGEIQSTEQQQHDRTRVSTQQQQAGGFGGFSSSSGSSALCNHSVTATAFPDVHATPVKIGQGVGVPTGSGGSSSDVARNPAAWIAGSSNNSSQQPPPASLQRAAAALRAAGDARATTSAAAAAAAADLYGGTGSNPTTPRSTSGGEAAAAAAAAAAGSISLSSPVTPRAAAESAESSVKSSNPYYRRSKSGGVGLSRSGSGVSRSPSSIGYPTCLICLDQLTPEDFESGEAMQLDCRCKGEVALRHRSCAEKWSRIKGSTICDVCKAPILNLPDVPPLPPPPGQGLTDNAGDPGLWSIDEPPAVADYIFDCIRVTWVVLIVCILFLELSVTRAFVTGALMGSAYVALAASWTAAQRRRRQQQRIAAVMWVAGQMPLTQQQEQRVPLLQGLIGGVEGLPV